MAMETSSMCFSRGLSKCNIYNHGSLLDQNNNYASNYLKVVIIKQPPF